MFVSHVMMMCAFSSEIVALQLNEIGITQASHYIMSPFYWFYLVVMAKL